MSFLTRKRKREPEPVASTIEALCDFVGRQYTRPEELETLISLARSLGIRAEASVDARELCLAIQRRLPYVTSASIPGTLVDRAREPIVRGAGGSIVGDAGGLGFDRVGAAERCKERTCDYAQCLQELPTDCGSECFRRCPSWTDDVLRLADIISQPPVRAVGGGLPLSSLFLHEIWMGDIGDAVRHVASEAPDGIVRADDSRSAIGRGLTILRSRLHQPFLVRRPDLVRILYTASQPLGAEASGPAICDALDGAAFVGASANFTATLALSSSELTTSAELLLPFLWTLSQPLPPVEVLYPDANTLSFTLSLRAPLRLIHRFSLLGQREDETDSRYVSLNFSAFTRNRGTGVWHVQWYGNEEIVVSLRELQEIERIRLEALWNDDAFVDRALNEFPVEDVRWKFEEFSSPPSLMGNGLYPSALPC